LEDALAPSYFSLQSNWLMQTSIRLGRTSDFQHISTPWRLRTIKQATFNIVVRTGGVKFKKIILILHYFFTSFNHCQLKNHISHLVTIKLIRLWSQIWDLFSTLTCYGILSKKSTIPIAIHFDILLPMQSTVNNFVQLTMSSSYMQVLGKHVHVLCANGVEYKDVILKN